MIIKKSKDSVTHENNTKFKFVSIKKFSQVQTCSFLYVLSVAAFELVIELSRSERFCSPQN